jgi:vacuolar-type H+-ATPase subunit I/STV1
MTQREVERLAVVESTLGELVQAVREELCPAVQHIREELPVHRTQITELEKRLNTMPSVTRHDERLRVIEGRLAWIVGVGGIVFGAVATILITHLLGG